MIGSVVVYTGLILVVAGVVLVVKPLTRLRVTARARGLVVAGTGVILTCVGLILPVSESCVTRVETRLDEFAPVWQFHEFHKIRVAASPPRVFEAIKGVRADEIHLFRTLTWIRRGGRPLPPSILNAGERESLIDVATRGGFVRLADDAPRELVIGTVIMAPPGTHGTLTPQVFQKDLAPDACRGTSSIARSIISRRPAAFAIPFSFMLPASRFPRCSSGSRASQLDASAMMARAISKPAM